MTDEITVPVPHHFCYRPNSFATVKPSGSRLCGASLIFLTRPEMAGRQRSQPGRLKL